MEWKVFSLKHSLDAQDFGFHHLAYSEATATLHTLVVTASSAQQVMPLNVWRQ
jgi:hypothetical protein